MVACNLKSVGKFHAVAVDPWVEAFGEGADRYGWTPLKSLSPSRLEIKSRKFGSPTVSDGERWSRRSTEQGGTSRSSGRVKLELRGQGCLKVRPCLFLSLFHRRLRLHNHINRCLGPNIDGLMPINTITPPIGAGF
jgi:hypothetical protein